MDTDPSPNTPVHRTATALPVARIGEGRLPALLTPDPAAERRVIEFFTAHIRNPHTRNAYALAAAGFAAWCEAQHIAPSLSFAFPLLLAKRRISAHLLILAAGEANENSRDHFPERR